MDNNNFFTNAWHDYCRNKPDMKDSMLPLSAVRILLSGQSSHSKKVILESLLKVLKYCGDYHLQTAVLKRLLSEDDVELYFEWFANAWFAGMPRTVSAFSLLYQPFEMNIRKFLSIYNSEVTPKCVLSIDIFEASWDGCFLQQPASELLLLNCNYGTRMLTVCVDTNFAAPDTILTENKITILCSNLESAQASPIMNRGKQLVFQELKIKSSGGCFTFIMKNSEDLLNSFDLFLKSTSEIKLDTAADLYVTCDATTMTEMQDFEKVETSSSQGVDRVTVSATPAPDTLSKKRKRESLNEYNNSSISPFRRTTRKQYSELCARGFVKLVEGIPYYGKRKSREPKIVTQPEHDSSDAENESNHVNSKIQSASHSLSTSIVLSEENPEIPFENLPGNQKTDQSGDAIKNVGTTGEHIFPDDEILSLDHSRKSFFSANNDTLMSDVSAVQPSGESFQIKQNVSQVSEYFSEYDDSGDENADTSEDVGAHSKTLVDSDLSSLLVDGIMVKDIPKIISSKMSVCEATSQKGDENGKDIPLNNEREVVLATCKQVPGKMLEDPKTDQSIDENPAAVEGNPNHKGWEVFSATSTPTIGDSMGHDVPSSFSVDVVEHPENNDSYETNLRSRMPLAIPLFTNSITLSQQNPEIILKTSTQH